MLDKELLDILACPSCHGDIEDLDQKLRCKSCGLLYPVRDGIPVMLIDEAEKPKENNA
ncbi:MAG: Trm112 family protein [Chlamydiota bacterium]|nr:Trm112 family protein [Chlamydiota bacterium]